MTGRSRGTRRKTPQISPSKPTRVTRSRSHDITLDATQSSTRASDNNEDASSPKKRGKAAKTNLQTGQDRSSGRLSAVMEENGVQDSPRSRRTGSRRSTNVSTGTTAVSHSQDENELAEGVDLPFICDRLADLYKIASDVLDPFFPDNDPEGKKRSKIIQEAERQGSDFEKFVRFHLSGQRGSVVRQIPDITSLPWLDPTRIIKDIVDDESARSDSQAEGLLDLNCVLTELNLAVFCIRAINSKTNDAYLASLDEHLILGPLIPQDKEWPRLFPEVRSYLALVRLFFNQEKPSNEQEDPQSIILETFFDDSARFESVGEALKKRAKHRQIPGVRGANVGRAGLWLSNRVRELQSCIVNGSLDEARVPRKFNHEQLLDSVFNFVGALYSEIETRFESRGGIKAVRNNLRRSFTLEGGNHYPIPELLSSSHDSKKGNDSTQKQRFIDPQSNARPLYWNSQDSQDVQTQVEKPTDGGDLRSQDHREVEESAGEDAYETDQRSHNTDRRISSGQARDPAQANRKRQRQDSPDSVQDSQRSEPRDPQEVEKVSLREVHAQAATARKKMKTDTAESQRTAPKRRKRWTVEEEQALVDYIAELGDRYAEIKKTDNAEEGSHVLDHRSAEDIRFKARNLKVNFLQAGQPLPPNFNRIAIQASQADKLLAQGVNPNRRN